MPRILIIDDDLDIADSLRIILEAEGFQVSHIDHLEAVVNQVIQQAPDLVILDVIFPDDPQGGFKVARSLSRESRTRHVPVILLSAVNQMSNLSFNLSDEDISEDFMPVQAFLEKPVEPGLLIDTIHRFLGAATGH